PAAPRPDARAGRSAARSRSAGRAGDEDRPRIPHLDRGRGACGARAPARPPRAIDARDGTPQWKGAATAMTIHRRTALVAVLALALTAPLVLVGWSFRSNASTCGTSKIPASIPLSGPLPRFC